MAKKQTVIRTCLKVVDRFNASLLVDGKVVAEHNNYVPDFMPEEHYGDYVELDIDVETGQILNWEKPTQAQLKRGLDTWV